MAKYRAELRQTHVGSAYDQYLLDTDSRCVANNFDNTSTDFSATNRPALKPGESLDQSMIKIDKLLKNLKTFSFNNPATTLNLNDNSTNAIYGKKVINDEVNKNSIVNGLFQTGFANLGVAIDPTSKTYTGLTGDAWSMPVVGISTTTGGGSTAGQKKLYYDKPWMEINKNSSGYDELSFGILGQTYSKAVLPVTVEVYKQQNSSSGKTSGNIRLINTNIGAFDGLLMLVIPTSGVLGTAATFYVGMGTSGAIETNYANLYRKLTKGIDYYEDSLRVVFPVHYNDSPNLRLIMIPDNDSAPYTLDTFDYTITKIITN